MKMYKTRGFAIGADQDRAASLCRSFRIRAKIWVGWSREVGRVSQGHREGCRSKSSWCEGGGTEGFLSTVGLLDMVQLAQGMCDWVSLKKDMLEVRRNWGPTCVRVRHHLNWSREQG